MFEKAQPTPVPMIRFDWNVQRFEQSVEFEISEKCNAITVINFSPVGTVAVLVNQLPLNAPLVAGAAGESFSIGGNLGEVINRRTLSIVMPAAGAIVYVVQKFYAC